jgi:hypothetical protein
MHCTAAFRAAIACVVFCQLSEIISGIRNGFVTYLNCASFFSVF